MNVKEIDVVKLSKLISQQVDQITCLECCECYIAPETANCGHTLCHNCWKGRRTCPVCSKAFDRRQLRVNIPLQRLSDDVHTLKETYQKLFNVKLEEFLLDAVCDIESNKDPTKHVKDWLTSSQNQFSAPVETFESGENLNFNRVEVSASNIQIHDSIRKTKSPETVVHVSVPQDDWDKIEPMPETEDLNKERGKNKENVIGPMDIEPFSFDENEYNKNKPRRSLRNKEVKTSNSMIKTNNNNSLDNISSKDSSEETEKKSNKTKQTWNNVKRMRKEFSKLNKINRNKLNVSIEMCKKTKNNVKTTELPVGTSPHVYDIDDNTPAINVEVPSYAKNIVEVPEMSELPSPDIKTNRNSIYPAIEKMTTDNDHENNCKVSNTTAKYNSEIKNANIAKVPFFNKSSLRPISTETNPPKTAHNNINSNHTLSNNDIQITFRVGHIITNIYIKKKNDSDVKISTDKGIQTSLTEENLATKNIKSMEINSETQNIKVNIEANTDTKIEHNKAVVNKNHITLTKPLSEKKNTDSADTATAQLEITESVERELSSIMECAENNQKQTIPNSNSQKNNKDQEVVPNTEQELEYLNDLDLFESGSVKEPVQMLNQTNYAASEILVSTVHSKNKTQKASNKRLRVEQNQCIISQNKKPKLVETEKITINESIDADKDTNINIIDSEPLNYDSVIGNVFASIDADMKEINSGCKKDTDKIINVEQAEAEKSENQKESENLFSVCILDKDNDEDEGHESGLVLNNEVPIVTEQNIEDFLTPVGGHNVVLTNTEKSKGKETDVEINDDSESVVEETPQKSSSFAKNKQKSNAVTGIRELNESQKTKSEHKKTSVVELSDTSDMKSKNITVIETSKRTTLETPLTIDKFVDKIKYKSTPVARKSLNFNHEHSDDTDPEQTLCPTNDQIAKTTQEKEFLRKAFEKTPVSMVRPLRSHNTKSKKLCIAGSCLLSSEDMKLKLFCSKHNFTYLDKYTRELTHLVVGVDEENKSQRSVKYMCALAASKWIVSFKWIEKCLEANDVVNEERFEVLDSTGDPGPMRSRLSKEKLFHGIAFYCFGPFSLLDEQTLKIMLEAAGGLVVKEVQDIKVTARKGPALLLAEPEDTQEDRFIYLAMDLSIVPVNFEWVLNCLGSYTLSSIHELLLCPSSILHKNVLKWPKELIEHEDD